MQDILDMLGLMWPAPSSARSTGPLGPRGLRFAALPHARRPTRLVPADPSATAARALAGSVRGRSVAQRMRYITLAAGGRLGALRLAPTQVLVTETPGAPSLTGHLGHLLGRPVAVAIHFGPPRANRKPVLQVFDHHGVTLAFAKVGVNALTRDLVRGEAQALRDLHDAGPRDVLTPPVLYCGPWGEVEVLVLGPVPTTPSGQWSPARTAQAMLEVSTAFGTTTQPLADTPAFVALAEQVEQLRSPFQPALAATTRRVAEHLGNRPVGVGAWHGDWTPWNMAVRPEQVVVWDWERFARGVPLGLDAVHFATQQAIRGHVGEPIDAVRRCLAELPVTLAPWGLSAEQAQVVATVYLLTIGARYAHDRQQGAGARLGDLSAWLFPALEEMLVALGVPGPGVR